MDTDDQRGVTYTADAVVIDLPANAIRVRVPDFPGDPGAGLEAMLDVGSNGRLIGVEIGEWYVTVMDVPGTDESYVRTADVLIDVSAETPPSITLPRRGAAYEITYPSGNECWQMKSVDGHLIQVCATIDDEPLAQSGEREGQTSRLRPRR